MYHSQPTINDVIVRFDALQLTAHNFQILVNLSEILEDSGEVGEMKLEIYTLKITKLQNYNKELIHINENIS